MNTVVLFGSARQSGATRALLDLFLHELPPGEVTELDCYRLSIAPCWDCRHCWKRRACSIQDDMQSVYRAIDRADCVVFASPMYFSGVPGPMKCMIDRLQMYWAGRLRFDFPAEKTKKGVLLFTGGAPSFGSQFAAAEIMLKAVLINLCAEHVGTVTVADTDHFPPQDQPEVAERCKELAAKVAGG